jgi:hypothetical protein
MTRIILDEALRGKLLNLSEPLELCDEAGRVLAHVTPVNGSAERRPPEPQISEEELQRREQEGEEYTTEEVMAYLEKL